MDRAVAVAAAVVPGADEGVELAAQGRALGGGDDGTGAGGGRDGEALAAGPAGGGLELVRLALLQDDRDLVGVEQAGEPEVVLFLPAAGRGREAEFGAADMMCRVVARSNADLQRVLDLVVADPSINRSSTTIALATQISLRTLPLLRSAGAAGR